MSRLKSHSASRMLRAAGNTLAVALPVARPFHATAEPWERRLVQAPRAHHKIGRPAPMR
jgi:hypothetical protein